MSNSENINPLGVSIIICCYNSAKRLPKTLLCLADQIVDSNIKWEILVVDNASKDGTRIVAEYECKKLFTAIDYKIVNEPEPGLSSARRKGIDEAGFEYLLFCDDDNWLKSDYVQTAFNIMKNDANLGVVGGQNRAEYEIPPPKWFLENPSTFAIGRQSSESGDITDSKGYSWGAGFVVKKSIFERLHNDGFEFVLTDRKGEQLTTGGDKELCLAIKKLGYRIFYDERLILKHYMPSTRYDLNNFLKLSFQNGKASFVYDVYNGKVNNYNLYFVKTIAETTAKLALANIGFKVFNSAKSPSLKYLYQRRIHYFSGKLHALLDFDRCKQILKIIRKNLIINSH
jgi:glycosyltransferase involved in cell wall biosynthesis